MKKISRLKKNQLQKEAFDLTSLVDFFNPQNLQYLNDQGDNLLNKVQDVITQNGDDALQAREYYNQFKMTFDYLKALLSKAPEIQEDIQTFTINLSKD